VLVNPLDDVSLKRIINVPTRGLGKKTLELLTNYQQMAGVSFWTALQNVRSISGILPKARETILKFLDLLEVLKKRRFELALSEFMEEVLDRTGMIEELRIENTLEAKSRIENLKEFLSVVVDFENHPIVTPETEIEDHLALFLESITLETDLDTWTPEEESLTLMTLHMAKGLEFPFVFMVGMEEDIFPHANSITQNREDMEEERRLCYVGITRAKKRVTLSYASSRMLYGFRASNLPSRFLGEIPQNLIQYLGPGLSKIDWQEDKDDDDIIFVPDEPRTRKHSHDDILEF
jgi:DNA helicase-2/ATP-dependent DNA helicase PcrA